MWALPRPAATALISFQTSVSRIRGDLRTRLNSIEHHIAFASDEFEAAASETTLHTLSVTDSVAGIVSTEEMVRVYDGRFAKVRSPGRPIYDAIRSAPPHQRCPLCGFGTVWTLDHHLPKRRFPALAVAPLNLVPACMECNKFKLASVPGSAEEEALHPYFDDIEADEWLFARVVESQPASLEFFVRPPTQWPDLLSERARNHFKMLKLSYRYGVEAGREIANLEGLLNGIYEAAGADAVRAHLRDTARSHESVRINSWQVAMYRALMANDWYCDGGFRI